MGLSFLAAPQTSDEQVAQTGQQFASGVKMGYQDEQAGEQRVADAAAAVQTAKDKADAAQARVDEATRTHQITATTQANEALTNHIRSRIAGDLAQNRALLEKDVSDAPTLDALRKNIATLSAEGSEFDATAGQVLANTPPGQAVQYPAKFLAYTGVPATADLSPQAKEEIVNKRTKLSQEVTEGAQKIATAAAAGPPGEKTTPTAEAAGIAFSGATATLQAKAARLASQRAYAAQHNDPTQTRDASNPNFYDPTAENIYKQSYEDFTKATDAINEKYSEITGHIRDGNYGPQMAQTYKELSDGLPPGTDLNSIQSHPVIRAVLTGAQAILARKQAASGLTPAEQVRQARYNRLAQILRTDQDPSGTIVQAQAAAGGFTSTPQSVNTALQNEDKPLPPPLLAPPNAGATGTTGVPGYSGGTP